MGIFHRRYFCIFIFLFLLFSAIATYMTGALKLVVALTLLSLALISIIFVFAVKKHKFSFLVCLCCLAFSGIAILNSYLFISLPEEKASAYVGEHSVEMEILSQDGSYDNSSKYTVKIKQIGEDNVNIRAYLDCDFESDFSFGDRVIAFASIDNAGYYSANDGNVLLSLTVDDSNPVFYKKDVDSYFSFEGIRVTLNGLRNGFVRYIDSLFDGKDEGFVKGLLINDKSGLDAKTISDFRIAGLSHLLAVSGVHVALLLGALELLLRKLFVPKKARCVTVAFFGLIFIALTGFAPSATRAVLMLFAVYFGFMFYEDSDAMTSLFVAVFVITLLSPYSVYDVGMWMSFFATLGLVTVYPILEKRLRYTKGNQKLVNVLKRLWIAIVKIALITVVANFFLLPIMWYFFGEISLVSIVSNLAVSPMVAVFLPLSAITLVFGAIPFVGNGFVWVTSFAAKCILGVVEFFAGIKGAMLSLNFPFVPILVILFCVSMSVMLVVKFKRRLLICIPPIAFTVAFAICLGAFLLSSKTQIKQIGSNRNEFWMIEHGASVAVCDNSDGSARSIKFLHKNILPYATDIDIYIVTHIGENHTDSFEKILQETYVQTLYLPLANDKDELERVEKMHEIACKYNIDVVFYASGQKSITYQGVTFTPYFNGKYGWLEINH